MPFIHLPQPWQLSEREVTPESAFLNRRRFLKGLIGAGVIGSALPLVGCQKEIAAKDAPFAGTTALKVPANPAFVSGGDRPLTSDFLAGTYNNFYEFGGNKHIWQDAQALPLDNWKVEVTGLVKNPKTYDIDDLLKFPLEERIYRFRCVEAWAMVVPWIGFPMNAILKAAEPASEAKFVRFISYYNPQITKGPSFPPSQFLPFPYVEALRVEEMANDLAFFAVGNYGRTLPKQHGAPIRAVIPWKYGFKGAKSIVKIEFVADQPATFWNTISPGEYKFESNVEPDVSHPRWSQKQERLVGEGEDFNWKEMPSTIYNGYGEYVADLYA
ncbi:MAG: protein-methionine-sulfoxide reductase catalytic subunit MsrP [Oculatellaceae cyanobacterium Prado106]|jgi:sulfoxide reductase catalytic subunit YedY|nr:protein-methionine-sulfoxide reductase catalytic subunit MsrP [Oculatellaceae cyanobacterium Prado106]